MPSVRQESIAIIGAGCVLPDAPDVPTFWRNLQAGHVAVRQLSGARWEWSEYGSEDPGAPERTYSFLGAPVEGLQLDWKKFKVPPIEKRLLHSIELMVLEAAHQAMTSAGYTPDRVFGRDRVAVIAGSSGMGRKSNLGFNTKWRLPELLRAARQTQAWKGLSAEQAGQVARELQEEFVQQQIDNSDDWAFWGFMSPVLGRVCSIFDLHGPHFCVDAHAASGLAAMETAVQGLMSGEWDMALVGAASPALSPMEYVLHSKLRRLSTRGVFPLDARADGTALGEGAVMFLLKPLEAALREGDPIQAVLRGVGGVSRGAGPVLTATDPQAHQRAAVESLRRADVAVDSVSYLETGATGLPTWDAHLVTGLSGAYQGAKQVSVGAVSESVGDLQSASSLAAMLKVILMLRERTLVPQRSFQTQHPSLALQGTPFHVNKELAWPAPGRRRAAIHAAGLGGVAYHAVVEEYVPEAPRPSVAVSAPRSRAEPIAIVGLSCRYPGAPNPSALWDNTLQGRSAVRDIPETLLPVSLYHDATRKWVGGRDAYFRMYLPKAALVEDPPFPFAEFGIPPSAVAQMDMSQRWTLEVARAAVGDAGYGPQRALPSERTAVIVATTPGNRQEIGVETQLAYPEFARIYRQVLLRAGVAADVAERFLSETRQAFQGQQSPITSETLPGILNSAPATRVARALDTRGPSFTVESACASTLTALSLAIQGLRDGRWDVAVVGGVWSQITVPFCVNMCFVGAISPKGQTRPFSNEADGFVHGEGCGIFVLKRLSDAQRDADRIYALIQGMGGATDGRGKSIFASQEQGQELAMRRALQDSGVEPASIQYVEAHGTGMLEGDLPEAGALLKVYGRRDRPVTVGALKPLIGHSYIASAGAAVIRAVLALQRGVLPPLFTGPSLNPHLAACEGQLDFRREPSRWQVEGGPRRAAVNAYGFGGTNYHLILEEYRGTL
ncbi:polyketide synthase [Hyalangium minutum]|uniref:Malonyl CoA-acyl carrier protein transacylase n=1 Tax=Hyalangium minutum TaxID=394096 RepID=A0A085WPA9_9BACT|nr:polyketide synthase [Hyalangium minutum]KFE69522.1 Malonyl CoA-acyl carrier protein transacylase [Hyalangium minutum]